MTVYAAHIVTSEAVALGEPEIIVMTNDEGMGADEVERFSLGDTDDLTDARIRLAAEGWRVLSEAAASTNYDGYWIVDVEKA